MLTVKPVNRCYKCFLQKSMGRWWVKGEKSKSIHEACPMHRSTEKKNSGGDSFLLGYSRIGGTDAY